MARLRTGPLLLGLALWQCWPSTGFLGGGVRQHNSRLARRAYDFDIAPSDQYSGLVTEEQDDGALRISTHGKFLKGNWNTVLGSAPLPAKGRAYWEVKIVKKPADAWECIGVAEPTSDVTMPLTKNKKGKGWFWGATWTDSFIYSFLEMKPEWNAQVIQQSKEAVRQLAEWRPADITPLKTYEDEAAAQVKDHFTGPGCHVGIFFDHPPFDKGTVVGVDVDMDDGSMAFWADGKYLGKVQDSAGRPVNLQGKKLVPAISIYGRRSGPHEEFSVMDLRTGLEPPTRP